MLRQVKRAVYTEQVVVVGIQENHQTADSGNTKIAKRKLVVPYVKQSHGGEPFPDELDDSKMHYGEVLCLAPSFS